MSKTNLLLIVLITIISCNKENKFDYPLVFTGDVINITDTSATFTAKVSNRGKYPILESGFIWGIHSYINDAIKIKNEGSVNGVYTLKTNEKLLPGKTYFVRAFVQTESTLTYGELESFKSPEGQINLGKWFLLIDNGIEYMDEFIHSSFTINGTTFFAFEDGTLYSYSHANNTFSYVLANAILPYADLSVVFNSNAYIFSENAFYRFDPLAQSFTKLATLNNDEVRYYRSGFIIKNKIYVGLGISNRGYSIEGYSKEFWKYDIIENTWQQVVSFPGDYREDAYSFSINNVGYIGGGFNLINGSTYLNDLWEYNPEKDQWIQKESLQLVIDEVFQLKGVNTDNFGYCFYKNKLFEYNPIFNFWERMSDLKINVSLGWPQHIFVVDSKIFAVYSTSYEGKKYFKMWVYEK